MTTQIIILIIGFLLVAKGGNFFVDSSVQIARHFGIPRILIGGTLVSLATTAPELLVSATASWMGDSGIAIGNAVGSAIANIGLIIGIVAILSVVQVDLGDFKRRGLWMLGSAVVLLLFSLQGIISGLFALGLLIISVVYLVADALTIQRHAAEKNKVKSGDSFSKKTIFLFTVGLVMVILGSRLLVTSGIEIAGALGVSSVIIGLTVIAIGTSLPELVTGIVAALKGVPDLSIGNVIGANVLNLAMITGVSGLIHPIQMSRWTQAYSFPWLFVFIALLPLV